MLDTVLAPLEWVIAWLMVSFHSAFSFIGLPKDSGFTWALSIVGLVIVIRIILIPLFVKQIHASRRMQLIQPEMQKIQKKYKGKSDPESRQAMTQETMGLYKRTGTNPFSSCLPILLQSPVFFALFRVLQALPKIASEKQHPIGLMTKELARSAEGSTVFGAPLSSYFIGASESPLPLNTKIVTVVLIILMSATTFTTQRQLMMKNMPANALDNPFAKQQKVMLYLMPLFFAFSGINFPIGVLLYWTTTNVWSMGQQFYTIRRMPAPGSPAVGTPAEDVPHDGAPDVANEALPTKTKRASLLEREGEVAADFLEQLLDIADMDGDIDVDVDGDRAAVAIVDSEEGRVSRRLVGPDGKVLEALQELTRLAVQSATGERSRLMLDVAGHRAERRAALVTIAQGVIATVKSTGEKLAMQPMTAFERKVVHDAVLASGLGSESEGVEPHRFVVILPA